MNFTNVRDLKYSKADNSIIDLFATCQEYGEIPMTLNIVDTEDYHTFIDSKGVETPLEQYCKKQTITPYVEPILIIIIPTSITMRQTRLYLLQENLLDKVEELVSGNHAWEIEWEYANEVHRSNQLIVAMQSTLNLSDSEVDTMFLEASKL